MGDFDWAAFWKGLQHAAERFTRWVQEHEQELRAAGIWASVQSACRRTGLYAPVHPEVWKQIADADASSSDDELRELILDAYGAGGVGYQALRTEVADAPLLAEREQEVEEVLEALENGKHYLVICGALPLVEYVLSNAARKWNHPVKQPINKRLFETDSSLTDEDEAHLLLHGAASEMLLTQIKEVWRSSPNRVGVEIKDLNRHQALHGTALGWATRENATRAVLLLAAACQVADPLLAPRPVETADAS